MPNDVLTRAIDALSSGHDLSREQAGAVLGEIMRGDASVSQIAGFLIGLRTKGETVEELAGLASTMRALATPVPCDRDDLVDTAGTGGGRPTFNVSTTAALVAGRYHSLVVDPELPACLERSAWYGDTVMAIRHRELPAEGVQFHPESVLTDHGKDLLRNFLAA